MIFTMTERQGGEHAARRWIWILLLTAWGPATIVAGPLTPAGLANNGPDRGRDVFVQTCAACHVMGAANAPRIGEKREWQDRLASGRPTLLRSVLKGKGGMPPKGGNASLTDDDAGAALDYLLSRIGQ